MWSRISSQCSWYWLSQVMMPAGPTRQTGLNGFPVAAWKIKCFAFKEHLLLIWHNLNHRFFHIPELFSSRTATWAAPETRRCSEAARLIFHLSSCIDAAYCVVVGVHVRDEDGRDLGQNVVHVLSVVSAELPERPLATVQQHRATRAAGGKQKTRKSWAPKQKTLLVWAKCWQKLISVCKPTIHFIIYWKRLSLFVQKHGSLDLFISVFTSSCCFWVKHSSNLKFRILVKMSTFQ